MSIARSKFWPGEASKRITLSPELLHMSRDLFALVVAWSVLAGGDILLLPIVSRLLTPAEYGAYALAFGLAVFLADAASLWVTSSLVRFLPAEPDEAARHVLRRQLWWATTAVGLTIALATCCIGVLAHIVFDLSITTLLLTAGLVPLLAVFSFTLADFQAHSRMLSYAAFAVARFVIATSVGIALITSANAGGNGLLIGLGGSLLVLSAVSVARVRPGFVPPFNHSAWEQIRAAAHFGFGVWLQNLGAKILRIGDRYLIALFVGAAAAGAYSAIYAVIAGLTTLIATPVITLITPKVYRIFETSGATAATKMLNRTNRLTALAIGVALVAFLGVLPLVQRFVLTDRFRDALPGWAIGALLLGCAIQAQGLVLGMTFSLVKRTSILARTFLISAAVNIVGNLLLIPLLGSQGAALMTLVAYGCLLALTVSRAKPLLAVKLDSTLLAGTAGAILIMLALYRLHAGWISISVFALLCCVALGLAALRPMLSRVMPGEAS